MSSHKNGSPAAVETVDKRPCKSIIPGEKLDEVRMEGMDNHICWDVNMIPPSTVTIVK
jgi:hypothetical protein